MELLKARILIVDDQTINVQLLQYMLEDAGYTELSSTRNPLEVCALHRAAPYDAILLDLQMPVMDGFAVMAALSAESAGAALPVIVLSAEPNHRQRALQAGAQDFISKPFVLVDVKTRIRKLLEARLLR